MDKIDTMDARLRQSSYFDVRFRLTISIRNGCDNLRASKVISHSQSIVLPAVDFLAPLIPNFAHATDQARNFARCKRSRKNASSRLGKCITRSLLHSGIRNFHKTTLFPRGRRPRKISRRARRAQFALEGGPRKLERPARIPVYDHACLPAYLPPYLPACALPAHPAALSYAAVLMTRKPAYKRRSLPTGHRSFLWNSQKPPRVFRAGYVSILPIMAGRWRTGTVIRHRVIRPIQLSLVVLITGPGDDPLVVSFRTYVACVAGYPTKTADSESEFQLGCRQDAESSRKKSWAIKVWIQV